MKLQKGFVHIYTGDAKGKTTAALGVALRAAGKGLKVCLIQFMKSGSEQSSVANVEGIDYKFFAPSQQQENWKWVYKGSEKENDKYFAQNGLKFSRDTVFGGNYDVVVLDEIIMAVFFNLISDDDVLEIINKKPGHVELILTGRRASEKLINAADYVSDIKKVKHPYDQGVLAREGIDY